MSNGTPQCLVQLTHSNGTIGALPQQMTVVGDFVYFIAFDPDQGEEQVWRTDGTVGGTVNVSGRLGDGQGGLFPSNLANIDGTVYFYGYSPTANAFEIFKTDGTPGGTTPITSNAAVTLDARYPFKGFGDLVFYPASDPVHGNQLYVTNSKTGMSQMLSSGNTADSIFSSPLTVSGNLVFFDAVSAGIPQLWVSDGTPAGTKALLSLQGSDAASQMTPLPGGGIFFFAGGQIYKSDGTAAGTIRITNLTGLNPDSPVLLGQNLYFGGYDATNGSQIWVSDGTANGTRRVTSLSGTSGSNVLPLTVFGNVLYFTAVAGGQYQVFELNGASSEQLTTTSSATSMPTAVTTLGNTVFFQQNGAGLWAWTP